jgi:hypothetical protein
MTTEARRRTLLLAVIAAATALAVWATWPRPAMTIEVDVGGAAFERRTSLLLLTDRVPLGDTVAIRAAARVRVINSDTATASLGVLSARAGEDLTLRVPADTGTYVLDCTAHPGRPMTWIIR